MKKSLIILLAIALIPSFQSCKKKEEPKPSAEELITQDDWIMYKIEMYDANGNLTNTVTANNKWVFAPSKDYYYYDNSGNLNDYGTWSLSDNDSKITLNSHDGSVYPFDIDKLTKNEFDLVLSGSSGKWILYLKR